MIKQIMKKIFKPKKKMYLKSYEVWAVLHPSTLSIRLFDMIVTKKEISISLCKNIYDANRKAEEDFVLSLKKKNIRKLINNKINIIKRKKTSMLRDDRRIGIINCSAIVSYTLYIRNIKTDYINTEDIT